MNGEFTAGPLVAFFAGILSFLSPCVLPLVPSYLGFLTGMTLGIFLVVQATMIADAVDDIERRTGMRNDGISFSSLTFVSKIMAALAVLVFGMFIVLAGYEARVTVTPEMQWTVFASLTLVPAASCLASAIPFAFYRLGRSDPTRAVAA